MRDLDELFDPVVSRKASAAARTPDFAAVERRGRQRLRRARAAAVGAVVAVAAVVSVVGAQVASYRSDTAPATPPGFDDSNGTLARAVESGDAYALDVAMTDAGSALSTWIQFPSAGHGPPVQYGFTLADGDDTYWSPMYGGVGATPLTDGGFVVGTSTGPGDSPKYSLVDEEGIRPLEIAAQPADLESGSYEGYALLNRRHQASRIFAVDVEAETAAPVAELADVTPFLPYPMEIPQTDDGALWVIDLTEARLVNLASDGEVSRYRLPSGSVRDDVIMSVKAISMSPDGRPILLWIDGRPGGEGGPQPPLTLKLSTVTGSTVHTFDYLGSYRKRAEHEPSAAVLPDGRLLVHTGRSLMRTIDSDWRQAAELDLAKIATYEDMRTSNLRASDEMVCLMPNNRSDTGTRPDIAQCTADGDTWHQVDLTP